MTDAIATASRHIGLAVDFLRLDSEAAAALQDAHTLAARDYGHGLRYEHPNGRLITDPITGEAATDPAGFLRAIERDRPALLGKGKRAAEPGSPSTQKPATAGSDGRDLPKATMTELFTAAALGDASAKTQIERTFAKQAGRPDPTQPNLTQLFTRAKNGDATARAELDKASRR